MKLTAIFPDHMTEWPLLLRKNIYPMLEQAQAEMCNGEFCFPVFAIENTERDFNEGIVNTDIKEFLGKPIFATVTLRDIMLLHMDAPWMEDMITAHLTAAEGHKDISELVNQEVYDYFDHQYTVLKNYWALRIDNQNYLNDLDEFHRKLLSVAQLHFNALDQYLEILHEGE